MSKFCPNCGSQLLDDARFCPNCGQSIGASQQQPAQSWAPPVPPSTAVPEPSQSAQAAWPQQGQFDNAYQQPYQAQQSWPQQDAYQAQQGWPQQEAYQPQQGWPQQDPYQAQQGWPQQDPYQPQQGWPQQDPYQGQQGWQQQDPYQGQQGWQQQDPYQGQQGWQQPYQNQPTPPKKSKAGLIIAICAVLLAGLAAVACFVWPGFLKSKEDTPATTAPQVTESAIASTEALPATTELPTEPTTTEPLPTEPVNPFLDVIEDDPDYDEYLWAYNNDVVEGGRFDGAHELSKGEALTMLWKSFGSPAAAQQDLPFDDVTAADDCYPAMLWAYASGLITGSGGSSYHPEDSMTRAQAVTILYAAVGANTVDLPRAYVDAKLGKYFYHPVNWGCANGILYRDAELRFNPNEPLLKADYVCWLARVNEPTLRLDNSLPEPYGFEEYGMKVNLTQDQEAVFQAATMQDGSLLKPLTVKVENYEVFDEANGYEPLEGYEWHVATLLLDYGDDTAANYNYSLSWDVDDYYYTDFFQDNMEYEDGHYVSFVIDHGEPVEILCLSLNADLLDDAFARVVCAVRVPKGYDGLVVRFNSADLDPGAGQRIYDVYNEENYVFFRFE